MFTRTAVWMVPSQRMPNPKAARMDCRTLNAGGNQSMGFKGRIRRMAERLTGYHILRSLPRGPRGVDVFNDIIVVLPNYRIETIFDVGANVGQSANNYTSLFPFSSVLCFEPVDETFRQLLDNTRQTDQVRCFKLALSSCTGRGMMLSQGTSPSNRLVEKLDNLSKNSEMTVENVDVQTLEEFCKFENIEQISYLKIDTEGNDLEVLKGAKNMLLEQRIDLVEVEVGMNPNNDLHVPFVARATLP